MHFETHFHDRNFHEIDFNILQSYGVRCGKVRVEEGRPPPGSLSCYALGL